MNVYLDTNIILGFFDSNDYQFDQINQLFTQNDLIFFTAPITILEFKSKIGQLWNNKLVHFDTEFENKLSELDENHRIDTITAFCFEQVNVEIISNTTIEQFVFNQKEYQLEDTLTLAIKIASHLHLRSLDLIQIISALKIKIYNKIEIQYFLTGDKKILDNANEIYKKTKILPIDCNDLLRILKIQT
jgi:predicted nucleic acid-binding protein